MYQDENPWSLPKGLCEAKYDHMPHEHKSKTLGYFWCTADQSQREPFRSEMRRSETTEAI